jgi:hypothetical protein
MASKTCKSLNECIDKVAEYIALDVENRTGFQYFFVIAINFINNNCFMVAKYGYK